MTNLMGLVMDFQSAFNLAMGLITFLGGWMVKSFSDDVRELQVKVQDIQVMVAGQYVTHADLEKMINAVFNKLDKIEEKIDKKADK
jgi:hypothetical protein